MDHTKEFDNILDFVDVIWSRLSSSTRTKLKNQRECARQSAIDMHAELSSLRAALSEKTAQVERLREVCQKLADSSEFHMRGLRVKCGPCSEYLRLAREALAATASKEDLDA